MFVLFFSCLKPEKHLELIYSKIPVKVQGQNAVEIMNSQLAEDLDCGNLAPVRTGGQEREGK